MSVIFFLLSIGFISPVDFKKRRCRPLGFEGQWPYQYSSDRREMGEAGCGEGEGGRGGGGEGGGWGGGGEVCFFIRWI